MHGVTVQDIVCHASAWNSIRTRSVNVGLSEADRTACVRQPRGCKHPSHDRLQILRNPALVVVKIRRPRLVISICTLCRGWQNRQLRLGSAALLRLLTRLQNNRPWLRRTSTSTTMARWIVCSTPFVRHAQASYIC